MTDHLAIEPLVEADLHEAVLVYNHYVLHSTATFHEKPFTPESFRELVFFENPAYGSYAIRWNGSFSGYVLLTQHKKREAYDRTAEVTIYLKPERIGRGIGSEAVRFIEGIAANKGFHALIATICGENEKSINLFVRNGYVKCAHYREVGMKFGQWLDVVAYEKILPDA